MCSVDVELDGLNRSYGANLLRSPAAEELIVKSAIRQRAAGQIQRLDPLDLQPGRQELNRWFS